MTRLLAALCVLTSFVALAGPPPGPPPGAPPAPAAKPPPTGAELNKALYAFGVMIAQRTPLSAGFTEAELKEIVKGITDATLKKTLVVKPEDMQTRIDDMLKPRMEAAQKKMQEEQQKKGEEAKKVGKDYLAKAEKEAGVTKLPSGVLVKTMKPGNGASPAATDTVKVHYKGTLIDGTEFDSSYKRGEPTEFPLNGVVKCWTEGVGKMKVGEKARLVCPSDTAYGERGAGPNIPPNSTLIFEVELISIKGK